MSLAQRWGQCLVWSVNVLFRYRRGGDDRIGGSKVTLRLSTDWRILLKLIQLHPIKYSKKFCLKNSRYILYKYTLKNSCLVKAKLGDVERGQNCATSLSAWSLLARSYVKWLNHSSLPLLTDKLVLKKTKYQTVIDIKFWVVKSMGNWESASHTCMKCTRP